MGDINNETPVDSATGASQDGILGTLKGTTMNIVADVTKEVKVANLLLQHCWKGGNYSYLWNLQTKESLWSKVGKFISPPEQWVNYDVYFGIHPVSTIPPTNKDGVTKPPEHVRSQNKYINAINCLFGDYDFKHGRGFDELMLHFDEMALYPSVIINSGGGLHCYWLLEPTITITDANRDEYVTLQADWVDFVGSDKGAKDLSRVLRLPGTINYKYDHKPVVSVVKAGFNTYSLEEIERVVGQSNAPLLSVVPAKPETKFKFNKVYGSELADSKSDFSLTENLRFAGENLQKLSKSRADGYSTWRDVGFALKELGDIGFRLFCEFSAKSSKFKGTEDCKRHWDSWSVKEGGITLNSLKTWADEDNKQLLPVESESRENENIYFSALSGDALLEDRPLPEYLIDNLIQEKTLNLLSGRAMGGKSLFAYDMIGAMLSGGYFLPDETLEALKTTEHFTASGRKSKQCNCLIMNYDMHIDLALLRVKAMRNGYNLTREQMLNLFVISRQQEFNVMEATQFIKLVEFIKAKDIQFILMDGLKQVSDIDENKPDIKLVLGNLQQLIELTGATILALHHLNKSTSDDLQVNISGHNNLSNYVDSSLVLTSPDGIVKTIKGAKERNHREGEFKCTFKYGLIEDTKHLQWFRHYSGSDVQPVSDYELVKQYTFIVLKNRNIGKMTFYSEIQNMFRADNRTPPGDTAMQKHLTRLCEDKLVIVKQDGKQHFVHLK